MERDNLEKLKQLERIAAEDAICRDYAKSAEQLENVFRRVLRQLPDADAKKLEAYVQYRQLHAQRMLWLACGHMEFQKE